MESEQAMLKLTKASLADLVTVATAETALTLLDGALAELDTRVEWARRLALRPLARGDFPNMPFNSAARDLLQVARRDVDNLSSTHAAVGRAFAVARRRIGAGNHLDLVAEYEARRHDALLFSAAGYAEAAAGAFDLARGVAYTSPLWRGWADAAEELARAAHRDASAALHALLGMLR